MIDVADQDEPFDFLPPPSGPSPSDEWQLGLDAPIPDSPVDLPTWLTEPILPADPRIQHNDSATATVNTPTIGGTTPPAESPLVYGLVAKITLTRPAFGFRVDHDLPPNVELVQTKPKAVVVNDHLMWHFERLDPGNEVRLQITVRPKPEAVLRASDLTHFSATYSQNLVFQAPIVRAKLDLRVSAPLSIQIGSTAEVTVRLENTGNWIAESTRANVMLPAGLVHPSGPSFDFDFGDLQAGEVKNVSIPVQTAAAGSYHIRATASSSEVPRVMSEQAVVVTSPALSLRLEGPSSWPLRRAANLWIDIHNMGDGIAHRTRVLLDLPEQLQTESNTYWDIGELAPGERQRISVPVTPTVTGDVVIRAMINADAAEATAELSAELDFEHDRRSPVLEQFLAEMKQESPAKFDLPKPANVRGESHVVFVIGESSFAVPMANVSEVGRPPSWAPLPNVPDWLVGVANVRGDVVPVIDLRSFFGRDEAPTGREPRMLVVKSRNHESLSAVMVDRVRGMRTIDPSAERPFQGELSGPEAPFVLGLAETEEGLVARLDIEQLLESTVASV